MKRIIQIAVPKPCHEKWSSFTKTTDGGFCGSCQKEVIDFTSWSDERIQSYFRNLKGNTCGRFRQDQLNVNIYCEPGRPEASWISFVFAAFLLLFSSRQVAAQNTPQQTTEHYMTDHRKEIIPRDPSATVTIIGTVTSTEDGQAMPGVSVILKGTSIETVTDAVGKFSLDMPNKDSSQFIVFSLQGFKIKEYMHNTMRPGREIAVDMTRNEVMNVQHILGGTIGGVVVGRRYEPKVSARDLWWWLTGR
ncbi:carboxypeptidase-like regulatory domain-containing protein [Chryseolinea sp. H1M3-3]|uniref:carboxypeptidase-like regulatory domain-containing protein n=1 Tax=Chryseolinea sp. H1M3-3 TaxID=3034144 RepID=UPI0023EA9674|nr:carboxypeptidase-like regulatory domain-containing protein [Chryseolinea sp. H1M3-3]